MTSVRVADFVSDWLSTELEVSKVFMVTGAGIMHLTDGIAKNPRIEGICLHHEQSVSMAVESYSRYTGDIGVAYVSTGPAATNALTGVAGAWQDSVACLIISGQVKVAESSSQAGVEGLRQFGVQELDILPMVNSVTKYSVQVSDPADVLFELEKAVYLARRGRPGPVWLEFPLDVQSALVDPKKLRRFDGPQETFLPDVGSAIPQALLDDFRDSLRPVIVAGQGVRLSGMAPNFQDFVRRYRIPIVSTYLGVDSYLPHDELYVGKIGVKGERAANIVVQKSDFLLVLGSSLHVSAIGYNYDQFAPSASKWVVDVDATSHKKATIQNSRFLLSDLRDFIPEMTRNFGADPSTRLDWSEWAQVAARLVENFPTCLPEYEQEAHGLNIYTVVDWVSKKFSPNDVAISDAGSAFYAVSQGIRLPAGARYLTSGAMATMGYSLPAAIGVAVAKADGRVFAFTGDGSLHQNIQELGQMEFLGLPIALVVLDNDGYLSIRASQQNYFDKRFIGTDSESGLGLPSIPDIARAYRLEVIEIETLIELREALDSISQTRGPVVLNVKCPPNQPIVPTVSSKIDQHGQMSSRNLHDMTPLLDDAKLLEIMDPTWGFL